MLAHKFVFQDLADFLQGESLEAIFPELPEQGNILPTQENNDSKVIDDEQLESLLQNTSNKRSEVSSEALQKMTNLNIATHAIRNRLAASSLQFLNQSIHVEIEQHFKNTLYSLEGVCGENENSVVRLEEIKSELDHASSKGEFLEILKDIPKKGVEDLTEFVFKEIHSRHQDTRDIERDQIVIAISHQQTNKNVYSGFEFKYDGVVDLLRSYIEKLVLPYQKVDDEYVNNAITRFARSIINVGNRTNSGGETYEVILSTFGTNEMILVTPDSEKADPIRVSLRLGVFETAKSYSYSWGVIARISASTFYLLTDIDHVEKSYGAISGTFQQELGMSLPLPKFKTQLSSDDYLESNRKDYVVKGPIAGKVYVEIDVSTNL